MATEGPLAGFLHFPISISAFISHVFLFLFLSSLEEEKIRRSRRPLSISWLLSHSEFSNQFTLASDLSGNKKVAISRYQSAKLSVGVRVYSPVMTSENVRLKTAVRLFFEDGQRKGNRWTQHRKVDLGRYAPVAIRVGHSSTNRYRWRGQCDGRDRRWREQSAAEFGGEVALAGTDREDQSSSCPLLLVVSFFSYLIFFLQS